jgi:hypothetical protein
MTDNGDTRDTEDGAWRDERELPLSELSQAVATSPGDGQVDDPSGNDAGIEQGLAENARDEAEAGSDPDPTSAEGRALRTDFAGPTGPN